MTDWKTTIETYGPDVWKAVFRIVGNEADAHDCFQETFLAAVQAAGRKPIRNMGAFLRIVAVQRAIDCLRQRRRAPLSVGEVPEPLPGCRQAASNPTAPIQSAELAAAVRAGLAELPEPEAQAFALRTFEELSYRQIAQALNVRENYAGVLISRAREKLRDRLKTAAAEYGWEFVHEQ